jgi:hypothetical protein
MIARQRRSVKFGVEQVYIRTIRFHLKPYPLPIVFSDGFFPVRLGSAAPTGAVSTAGRRPAAQALRTMCKRMAVGRILMTDARFPSRRAPRSDHPVPDLDGGKGR